MKKAFAFLCILTTTILFSGCAAKNSSPHPADQAQTDQTQIEQQSVVSDNLTDPTPQENTDQFAKEELESGQTMEPTDTPSPHTNSNEDLLLLLDSLDSELNSVIPNTTDLEDIE
ncbi:hypothetical protein LRY65_00345 [Candidatus Woesebacteria bacterium]|nr:hypothetical protein [Candidatus Woesebacteria bacterium]MCD8507765.1 hypothetical protein [Candidatus Woesebacteria bacterium]MCD8526655.1 hypothetical protein [Candidatus Woesebacteria bacterium]MCD8545877.1 hypothetical protein [Candidatus Woesebacteria bacterium]